MLRDTRPDMSFNTVATECFSESFKIALLLTNRGIVIVIFGTPL